MAQEIKTQIPATTGRPAQRTQQPLITSIRNNVDVFRPVITDVPLETKESLNKWMTSLYDVKGLKEDFIQDMWEAFAYKGFNREDVLKQLHVIAGEQSIAVQLIVVAALRGPQAASNIKLLNGKTPREMGIAASGGQGTKVLTLNKIVAATADIAAFILKRMDAPKRLPSQLPGWLQFPSAGSIKLPQEYRELHIEFSKRFSPLIGGSFNESIYQQMITNAYLDDSLKLFTV